MGGHAGHDDAPPASTGERAAPMVRELLAAVPAGCTWLLPVADNSGDVVDFEIAATGGRSHDVYGRPGEDRVSARLRQLYPAMVGGPLWQLYHQVARDGVPGRLDEFRFEEHRAGVVATSLFEVDVRPALGGLLVWWHRIDEDRRRLEKTELLGNLGWAEYDLATGRSDWTPGMYRIFERDPDLGPMSRAEQAAAVHPQDSPLRETAWQTLDSGAVSDVTVRFTLAGKVKHLRIVSDIARDASGVPLKIYAVVQDVSPRENSRTAIEQLSKQLRTHEMTALAEHRLAAQLQNMIQPLPAAPFTLSTLEAMVSYLPAESAVQVGGDWYHAQTLPDGRVLLALGDVVGHGLRAATGMAHLRYALIAWTAIGIADPGTLLRHMNGLCLQLDTTATAIIATYEPDTRAMCWARAGHFAPLLARDGHAQMLPLPAGILLGAKADPDFPVVTEQLRANDLALFYTDGLVERRGRPTSELVKDVEKILAEASTQPDDGCLLRLRSRLHYGSPDDDTCALAIRVLPA